MKGGRTRGKIVDFGKVAEKLKIEKKIDRVLAFEQVKWEVFQRRAGGTGRQPHSSAELQQRTRTAPATASAIATVTATLRNNFAA